MLRKFLLTALATVFLLQALPAIALGEGALEDVSTHETIGKGVEFSYSGAVEIVTAFGGFNCGVHTTFKTKLADEFEVTAVEVTTETCEGSNIFEGCTVVGDNPNLPWPVGTYTTTELRVLLIGMELELGECFAESFYVTEAEILGKPSTGSNGGITALTLSGGGIVELAGLELEAEVSGALSMSEENSDTYRIEELP